MPKTYTFRLTSEGITELKSQLDALGPAGVASFQKIIDATPGLGSALDSAAKKAEAAHARLVAATQADFSALQASLNPAIAAQQQFAKGRDVVTAAQAAGVATDVQAATALAELEARFGTATSGVALFSKGLSDAKGALGVFGIALGVGAVLEFGRNVLESAGQLQNQAAAAGVSVKALQAYRAATSDAGLSADDTDKIIQRFTRSIGDATATVGPARTAFHDLGITAGELAAGPEAALPKVAAAILAIPDATVRARTEIALFGRSGQEIEPALRDLSAGLDTLSARAVAAGLSISDDLARKSKESLKEFDDAIQSIKVSATPVVTGLADAFATAAAGAAALGQSVNKIAESGFWTKVGASAIGILTGARVTGLDSGQQNAPSAPTGNYDPSGLAGAYGLSANGNTFGQEQFNQYLAGLAEETRLTGLSKTERAAETEAIKASVELQKDQGVSSDKINQTYAFAVTELKDQGLEHIRNLGIIAQQNTAAEKLKETFDKYLLSLQEEARAAGEAPAQREAELAVIKAAQIVQTQQQVDAKNLVQTYAQAVAVLQPQRTALVESGVALKQNVAYAKELGDQQAIANAALAADVNDRDLAVQIAQKEIDLGRQLTDVEKDRLKTIQATNDAATLKQGIEDLKEQVQLSGMLPDQAEQYRAVLQAIHETHGNITDDQKQEIQLLVQQQQEAQKVSQLTQGFQDDFASFFDNILEHGKFSWSSLLDDWKRTFAQFLSQMLAQAIAQPIIIPMVESLIGTTGLTGAGGAANAAGLLSSVGSSAAGGGGLLGSLGNISSVGSLFGGGGSLFSGVGNAINAFGSSLSPSLFGVNIAATDIPGLGTLGGIQTAGSLGTLGSSLGGILGGAGIGSLAGSLLFGNKNDAGLGSMGGGALGAAIGSIIPGVGTLIGGLLGGILGGGLGSLTGSDNHGAWVDLTNGGLNYSVTQQGSSQNTQQVSAVADSLTKAVQALKDAGVSITNNIKSLEVGSSKDVLELSDGTKINSAANSPDTLLSAALGQILGSASSSNSSISAVIQSYQNKGGITQSNLDQFLSDIGFANSIQNIQFGEKQLDQVGQALQEINTEFQTAIDHAQELGLDTSDIIDAKTTAIQQIIDGFNQTVSAGLKQLNDPIGAAIDSIVATQTQRLDDASQLGIDPTQALALNAAEAKNVLNQYLQPLKDIANSGLDQYTQQMNAVDTAVANATEAAKDLGLGLDDVNAAADAARAAIQAQTQASEDQTASAKTSLGSLITDLTSGSDSPLSAAQKYANLLQQYQYAASAASPSDATSIGNFQSAAQALLPAAREFLGTSQSYGALTSNILSTTEQLGGALADPSGVGRAMIQAQMAGSSAIVNVINATNDKLDDLTDKFGRLSAQLAAMMGRLATT